MNKDLRPIITDLDPHLTSEEQIEAMNNLNQYLDLVKRIYDRLEIEGRLDEIEHLRVFLDWHKSRNINAD